MSSDHSRHRTRSRSPDRAPGVSFRQRNRDDMTESRHREHAHYCRKKHTDKKHKHSTPIAMPQAVILPFSAQRLSKHQLRDCRALFASYLDIQKQIDIDELDESEIKGRWKSFVGKWNRGELAEGWYDPNTKRRVDEAARFQAAEQPVDLDQTKSQSEGAEEDEDEYGPRPAPAGAQVPFLDDLAVRDELIEEDAIEHRKILQQARRADRTDRREKLEELLPRAEPGSKERMMEKKREAGAAANSYREKADGTGEMEDIGEKDLMGDADDLRAIKKQQDRQKNERELRREEALRARAEEREHKVRGLREREEQTMERLKALAKSRFG